MQLEQVRFGRLRLVALLLLLLVSAAAACGDDAAPDEDTAATDTAAAPDEDDAATEASGAPIIIGVNVEQSGPAAALGEAYVRALELRARQINEAGGLLGRPVELVVVDNMGDGATALTNVEELLDDGIVAMIGPGTTPTTLAAMEELLSSGLPVFSMGSSGAITNPVAERPNIFKTPANNTVLAREMANYALAQGIDAVGLIAVNNPYGESGANAWRALADEGLIEIVGIEGFESGTADFTAQLSSLVDAGAEAIVVVAIVPDAPNIRKSGIESLGLEIPMYFDAGAGAELFVAIAGDSADGAFVFHPKTLVWDEIDPSDPQFAALEHFGRTYEAEYGSLSGFAGYAWDALDILAAAIEQTGGTDAGELVDAIENTTYAGVTGVFKMSPSDHQGIGLGSYAQLIVVDGHWQLAG